MGKVLTIFGMFTVFGLTACTGSFSIFGSGLTSGIPSPAPTPVENAACTPSKTLKQLAIYYGWPSGLNTGTNGWDLSKIAADFAQYDSVILGAGLEEPGHGDNANTAIIVAAIPSTTQTFGYLDVGRTNNYDMTTLKDKVDKWASMTGLAGIFLDEFGFDFAAIGATDAQWRVRQKEIVDYVHLKGLSIFVNSFDPDDVFVKEASNPLTIQSGDRMLYESYIFSWSTRETFAAYRSKATKLKQAMAVHPGLQVYAISTKGNDTPSELEIEEQMGLLAASAIADGFTGVGRAEEHFSASSLTGEMPKKDLPSFATSPYCLNGTVTENSGSETITYSSSAGSVTLNYNASGNPSYTLQP